MNRTSTTLLILFILLTVNASGYIGPGGGLSAIGAFFALLAAILLAIVGFVWYPLKRLFTSRKNKKNNTQDPTKP